MALSKACREFHVESGCDFAQALKDFDMVKIARKIRLEKEGNDTAYWLSRPAVERLRALDGMRRMYIKAYVASGKRRLPRVYRVVKLKCG
jgi:hypothetical protein